ncbi:MAG: hypothetical protein LBK61_04145, partial [Spirochaetaceae bacterium]|nr:hypothetical protein [Spirochaetaceae bacterium]
MAECPAGGENPLGFHPFANPILAENQRRAGRAPPYGGMPLPGAKTRRVFIPSCRESAAGGQ